MSWIPESGRSSGGGNGNPLQHSGLENSMGRKAWWASVHGVAKSWTQLSAHARSIQKFTSSSNTFPSHPTSLKELYLLSFDSEVSSSPASSSHRAWRLAQMKCQKWCLRARRIFPFSLQGSKAVKTGTQRTLIAHHTKGLHIHSDIQMSPYSLQVVTEPTLWQMLLRTQSWTVKTITRHLHVLPSHHQALSKPQTCKTTYIFRLFSSC